MQSLVARRLVRRRIRHRIRKKASGTAQRPRLAVFRSDRHIYAQAIDDVKGRTLAQASTRDPEVRAKISDGGNLEAAKVVGDVVAERLKTSGIETVIFDRGGYLYHGRVKALAEAMRSAGMKF